MIHSSWLLLEFYQILEACLSENRTYLHVKHRSIWELVDHFETCLDLVHQADFEYLSNSNIARYFFTFL